MYAVCAGIAGGSGAGKSTLTARLLRELGAACCSVLEQDSYYRDRSDIEAELRAGLNYDHPDAIEWDLLAGHVARLKAGQAVSAPVYDFATHTRVGTREVRPGRVLLVEGILVLHSAELAPLLDVRVFVDMPEQDRLERRTVRDIRERGRTRESVHRQFEQFTRPMHDLYVEPAKASADYVVSGNDAGEPVVLSLLADLRARLRGMR